MYMNGKTSILLKQIEGGIHYGSTKAALNPFEALAIIRKQFAEE